MGKILVSFGGHADLAEIPWISEVSGPGRTFQSLANSGPTRFHVMDLKLSTVLTGVIRNATAARTLYDDLMVREASVSMNGSMLKGRQIMFMILEFFKTNRQMQFMYTIEDLAKLEWLGDRDLHTFRHRWSLITEGLSDNLSEETLATVLAKKLEQSQDLKEDIAYYYRCTDDHGDHSYTYLRSAMDRRLARKQQKKNRDDQTREWATRPKDRGLTAAPARDPPASAVRGAGKGRGKAQARSKSEPRPKQQPNTKGEQGQTPCRFFNSPDGCRMGDACLFKTRQTRQVYVSGPVRV